MAKKKTEQTPEQMMEKNEAHNDGTAKDVSQGNTEIKIEKDGSYQVNHKTIEQLINLQSLSF